MNYIKKKCSKATQTKRQETETGVVEKEVLNSKKFCTLRLFSHVVAQHFLPEGGHGVALHYLAIEADE